MIRGPWQLPRSGVLDLGAGFYLSIHIIGENKGGHDITSVGVFDDYLDPGGAGGKGLVHHSGRGR